MNIDRNIRISNYFVKDVGLAELEQWWATCAASHITCDGCEWYVLNLVGSPMTGNNRCLLINAQGDTRRMAIPHFKTAWQSLVRIKKETPPQPSP